MSYIGRQLNNLSDRVKLDSITASATATYNLLLNTVAYVPSSAESLTVSLNGVIQAPQDSYTVSGSTITFASTLSASDSIDFILAERSITLQTPSSGSVNTEQLASGSVTAPKLSSTAVDNTNTNSTLITAQTEKTSLADADKFLISDSASSGALKYVQKSNLPSGALSLISATAVTDGVSAFNIANIFSSSYQMYMMIIQNIRVTSDCNIRLRFGASGTYNNTASYRYVGIGRDRSGTDRSYNSGGDTSMLIIKELDGNDGLSHSFGVYYFANPNISATNSNRKRVTGHYTVAHTSGNSITTTYNFAGELEVSTTAFDGIRLLTDSGTFRGGTASDGDGMIKIYGIADS